MPENNLIRIGMLGFGTVGSGAYQMLSENYAAISRKIGVDYEVVRVGIRDMEKPRLVEKAKRTTDLDSIIDDPSIDVILELMGGVDPAGRLVERALRCGKHVVTANKELIAKEGSRLIRVAAQSGLDLHFEAAVGGGIPLIQPLKHQLAGNDVIKLIGIVNGTTNYILTRMQEDRIDFASALEEAQQLGYAEADPSSDVDGFDAQYKLAILSSIAFGGEVKPAGVFREGIRKVSSRDIQFAELLGFRIKLVAIVEDAGQNEVKRILARVHPALIPMGHPLADVKGVYNAVWVQGDFVGDVMFTGRGAGASATGSAVVGDLIDVCRNMRLGGSGNTSPSDASIETLSIDRVKTKYFIRMRVFDKPKVLGYIAMAFGDHDISLAAMEMRTLEQGMGEIVFLTHPCLEASFKSALARFGNDGYVDEIENWIRVEGDLN